MKLVIELFEALSEDCDHVEYAYTKTQDSEDGEQQHCGRKLEPKQHENIEICESQQE